MRDVRQLARSCGGVLALTTSPRCLISDLDRTLTEADLVLVPDAIERIRALRRAGLRVVIATGRRFDDIEERGILSELDGVVAENGAIVCAPGERVFEVTGAGFARTARAALGELASAFAWGRVVGSGPRALAAKAQERLRAKAIPHVAEFNAEEVMLLPEDVNKARGAERCLRLWGLTAKDAWAIGDGENDVALLRWAQRGGAPANAVPAAREAADIVLASSYARGFCEFTEPLLQSATSR